MERNPNIPLPRFSNVPEDTATSLTTGAEWRDDYFDEMIGYKITPHSRNDLITIFHQLVEEMSTSHAKKNCHLKALLLAVHLGLPTGDRWIPLISEFPEGVIFPSFSTESNDHKEEPRDIFSEDEDEYEDENIAEATEEERAVIRKRNEIRKGKKEEGENNKPKKRTPFTPKIRQTRITDGGEFEDVEIKYATFIGAFLMKLITKDVRNIKESWKAAHRRFKGFYLDSPKIELAIPKKEWLESLKEFLNHDKKCTRTILKVIIKAESEHPDPDSNEAGIIRYAFSLPLSYTGMHAYKLFQHVKSLSGMTNEFLLNALVHPKNNKALFSILDILRNWESRIGEAKSTKFRYARLVGPQYFMALQTKNCPALVYCLACMVSQYVESENSNFKPENIVGLKTVSYQVKREMELAARKIVTTVSRTEKDEYSPFMSLIYTCEGGVVAAGTEKERVISGEDAVCCICLAKYTDDDELRELPCSHFFHTDCVDKWLKINASCPLCKIEVGETILSSLTEATANLRRSSVY